MILHPYYFDRSLFYDANCLNKAVTSGVFEVCFVVVLYRSKRMPTNSGFVLLLASRL
jgi:hypothetical protein